MCKRYWIAKWSAGYVGTEEEEKIDLTEDFGYSEEDLVSMTDEDAEREVNEYAREQIMQLVDWYSVPDEDR